MVWKVCQTPNVRCSGVAMGEAAGCRREFRRFTMRACSCRRPSVAKRRRCFMPPARNRERQRQPAVNAARNAATPGSQLLSLRRTHPRLLRSFCFCFCAMPRAFCFCSGASFIFKPETARAARRAYWRQRCRRMFWNGTAPWWQFNHGNINRKQRNSLLLPQTVHAYRMPAVLQQDAGPASASFARR